jgi:hypothetical protein
LEALVPRRPRIAVLAGLVALAIGWLLPAPLARPAAADVVHHKGYRATVAGFSSWYGSYAMGDLGTAWCIDHGIAAPDPDLAYVKTRPATSDDVRAAMAWAANRYGPSANRVDSAALMLVFHDLMGAQYPTGPLKVAELGPADLDGFGADEGAVITRSSPAPERSAPTASFTDRSAGHCIW